MKKSKLKLIQGKIICRLKNCLDGSPWVLDSLCCLQINKNTSVVKYEQVKPLLPLTKKLSFSHMLCIVIDHTRLNLINLAFQMVL